MDLGVSISAVFENILSLVVADGNDTRTPQSKIGETAAGVSRKSRFHGEDFLDFTNYNLLSSNLSKNEAYTCFRLPCLNAVSNRAHR